MNFSILFKQVHHTLRMFGRGGPRPGSGRPKKVKTPVKRKYRNSAQTIYRRQTRAKFLSLQKKVIAFIRRGDSMSEEYKATVAEYNRVTNLLGKLGADPAKWKEQLSSDEVRISLRNNYWHVCFHVQV